MSFFLKLSISSFHSFSYFCISFASVSASSRFLFFFFLPTLHSSAVEGGGKGFECAVMSLGSNVDTTVRVPCCGMEVKEREEFQGKVTKKRLCEVKIEGSETKHQK